jgi:NADPH-dependent ferric siderophore reductase
MADAPGVQVFRAIVVRVEDLSPSLRRIVFGGPELASFVSTGCPDEYLRVLLPPEGRSEPVLPVVRDGAIDYGTVDLSRLRTYTVRSVDTEAGEVSIDFVLHAHGVATVWARSAEPGDVVGLNSPSAMYDPPEDLAWQLLVADCAGLPALARILEQTPDGVRTRAVVEVPGEEHRIDLPDHPHAEVTWVYGGNGTSPSRLAEVLRTMPAPDSPYRSKPGGYLWVAGESRALRGVRRHLRRELELPASRYKAVGYWIERGEEWSARYAALDEHTRRSLEALWETDRPEEEIESEYDERLTALGL